MNNMLFSSINELLALKMFNALQLLQLSFIKNKDIG